MYLIQFHLQFVLLIFTFYTRNSDYIKATRLQTWAPAGGGKSRPSPPPPSKKGSFLAILWAFLLRFSHFGGLFTMWGPFCHFLLHGGGLFLGLPPPPTKISAGAHDCKEGSRAYAPKKFFCVTAI